MADSPGSGAFVDRLAAAQARIAEVHRDSPILITLSAAENAARLQAHRDANHGRDALLRDKAGAILALVEALDWYIECRDNIEKGKSVRGMDEAREGLRHRREALNRG